MNTWVENKQPISPGPQFGPARQGTRKISKTTWRGYQANMAELKLVEQNAALNRS